MSNGTDVDEEGLVTLLLPVPLDLDRDGLAGLSRSEGQGARRGHVVLAGPGAAVGRGVIDRHRLLIDGRQRHDEGETPAAPALAAGRVADPDAGLVVDKGAGPLGIGDLGSVGGAEGDRERLARLAAAVTHDRDVDRLAGLAGGKGQRPFGRAEPCWETGGSKVPSPLPRRT